MHSKQIHGDRRGSLVVHRIASIDHVDALRMGTIYFANHSTDNACLGRGC